MLHWLYQGLAEPPPGALSVAETVTLDKWYQPTATPPRVPRRALSTVSIAPLVVPEQLVDPVVFVLPSLPAARPRARLLGETIEPLADVSYAWLPAINVPNARLPARQRMRTWSASAEPLLVPEDPWQQIAWLAQAPQPGRRTRPQFEPVSVSPWTATLVVQTLEHWLPAVSQPLARSRRSVLPGSVEPVVANPAAVTITVDMWLPPLAQPQRVRRAPTVELWGVSIVTPSLPQLADGGRQWILGARLDRWSGVIRVDQWQVPERRDEWKE